MNAINRRTFVLLAAAPLLATACATAVPLGPVDENPAILTKSEVYKTIGDRELVIDLYFPAEWEKSDHRPAIVFFFGGGWEHGSRNQFTYQAQYLAGRGMVAGTADYRIKNIDGVDPPACVEDAKSAVRWLRTNRKRFGIDPDRIVVAGGSAGGHIAASTALTAGFEAASERLSVSSMPNALVLFNPVLDFVGVDRLLDRVHNDQSLALQISPTRHLEAGGPPAILFYGSEDRLLTQGKDFASYAKEEGNRAELYVTEGVGHGFFNKPPYREQTLALADRFLVSLGYLDGSGDGTLPYEPQNPTP